MHWWFPENASSYGGEIDNLFVMILYITGAVFFLVEITLLVFLFKYRKKEGVKATYVDGSTRAEIIWTAIPAVIVIFLGVFSQPLWSRIKDPAMIPADAIVYDVTAKQFEWHFRYPGPDGRLETDDDFEKRNELHVIVNRDYEMRLHSEDVIHSFFIPAFRIKQDAVPGRAAWATTAREPGFSFTHRKSSRPGSRARLRRRRRIPLPPRRRPRPLPAGGAPDDRRRRRVP
jgi:cytochrome c oxidase subunit 2